MCGRLVDGVQRHTVAACGECLVLLVAALVRLFAVTARGQLLAVVVVARGRRLHAVATRWLVAVAAWGMRLLVAQMWLMARDVRRGGRLLAVAAQRWLFLVVAGGRQLFSMAWGRWLFAALSWCPATGRVRHPVTVFVRQFTVAVATSAWGRQLLAVVALNRRLFMVTATAGYMGCALCLR